MRASGPPALHIWTTNQHQWQPEAQDASMKMEVAREEKAPRETSCRVYGEFPVKLAEKGRRTSDVLPYFSPHLGEATHIMGGTMKSLLD